MSNQFLALIVMRLGIAYAYSRHEEFCQNYNVTMKAVEQHGNLLEHASDDLKANKLVVLKPASLRTLKPLSEETDN